MRRATAVLLATLLASVAIPAPPATAQGADCELLGTGCESWISYYGQIPTVAVPFPTEYTAYSVATTGSRVFMAGLIQYSLQDLLYGTGTFVAAYDATTGAPQWATTYSGAYSGDMQLAVASPTRLVAGWGNQLRGLNPATGATSWSATLPNSISALQAVPGANAVAILTGNSGLRMVDANSGATLWSTAVTSPGGSLSFSGVSSPVAATSSHVYVTATWDVPSVVLSTDTRIATIAYGASTGNKAWEATFKPLGHQFAVAGSITTDGSDVYVAGRSWVALDNIVGVVPDSVAVAAYDGSTGSQSWTASHTSLNHANDQPHALTVSGGKLFVLAQSTGLDLETSGLTTLAFDAAWGGLLWASGFKSPSGDEDIPVSVLTANGRVFVAGITGANPRPLSQSSHTLNLISYDPDTGEQISWAHRPGSFGSPYTHAVSTDGASVFAAGKDGLRASLAAYPTDLGTGLPGGPAPVVYDGDGSGVAQGDVDGDGMGDPWTRYWAHKAGQLVAPAGDLDGDGLLNVDEFRWELVPACVAGVGNCMDHEGDELTGLDGDGWLDGDEVAYWNGHDNDAWLSLGQGTALYDPDRLLDSDGDLLSNVNDVDSDDDGLKDGDEANTYGTYPEHADSDCDAAATECTTSTESGNHWDLGRTGNPGKGDLLGDGAEAVYWDTVSASAWSIDYDGDGIAGNLLDADADGDTLLDGEEVTHWQTKPFLLDSDLDGLQDGDEVRVYRTDPADWDTDGDGMPDGWETEGNLNPLANDAGLDQDADGLPSLGEYAYGRPAGWSEATQGPWSGGTNPTDADTEGDSLLDGPEVLTHLTNPKAWDSDGDALPDSWELQHGFDARTANDASGDPDGDSFDQGNDGSIQQAWPNLEEYQYQRPASWSESSLGPWQFGTNATNPDTDDDGASDGQEAYFGTDARLPADVEADDDGDGLTWSQEAESGTNPSDADSDGDGLCDGSRGANCRFPGLGSTGNMPGELDYGSVPWEDDSDGDGRSDSQEAEKWDPGATGAARDIDGDLLNGIIDSDSDNDGLADGDEFTRTTDMELADTDGDRLKDGDEVHQHLTNPKLMDSDSDGLFDGDEVEVHHTKPKIPDTDGDGLLDGAEVVTHGTDPLLRDTDQDTLPDGWEVQKGAQPRVADADQDLEPDGLTNVREYTIGSHPNQSDSDLDGLPDGYEDQYTLGVTVHNPTSDPDGDGLGNLGELNAKTHPRVADTDGDAALDGWELNTARTDPLDPDTDKDGLNDGAERDAWNAKSYPWSQDPDGDTLNGLRDPDSDNDGLNDRDELIDSRTKPHVKDSDGDGLSDHEEVVGFGGQFNPNDPDTDGDGRKDGIEASLLNPEKDTDQDGLKNGDEGTKGTDPTQKDTDCDGVMDGPESNYWGPDWNSGGNRLLNPDWDGDGIKDGLELGTVGTPSQAFYRTNPALWDTDNDGLGDNEEARNNAKIVCGEGQTSSMSSVAGPTIPSMPSGPMAPLQNTPIGSIGKDAAGWFVQGGYGVKLHSLLPSTASLEEVVQSMTKNTATGGPGTNGKLTDPMLRDTDGDGLNDGQELRVLLTTPTVCDSDGDGLGDGLELGITGAMAGTRSDTPIECQQRDFQPSTVTNPLKADSDNDGWPERKEDANRNGVADWGESNAADGDTDDDGILDSNEGVYKTLFNLADSDRDGLSDGLEIGLPTPQTDLVGLAWTATSTPLVNCAGIPMRTAWQRFYGSSGVTTSPNDADTDNDGIIDGLEDLNSNGIYGDYGELYPRDVGSRKGNDYDGDGLLDGLELLLWGQSSAGSDGALTYDFCQIAHPSIWGSNEGAWDSKLSFNSAEPFQTNPRSSTSDTDAVPDGQDLNPRSDASLAVEFGDFFMTEHFEACEYGWNNDYELELFVSELSVTLPFNLGSYVIHMDDSAHVDIPDAMRAKPFDGTLLGKLEEQGNLDGAPAPSALETLWNVNALASGSRRLLQFDIPDNVGNNVDLSNTAVTVSVQLRDDDWGCNGNDDDIDLNPSRASNALSRSINLADDLRGKYSPDTALPRDGSYQAWKNQLEPIKGDKAESDGDEDASLGVRMGDAVPSFFLTNLGNKRFAGMASLPSNGNCYGTSSCL